MEKHELVLDDFASPGHILDIGGGGEGVVGILKGESVVAVDRHKKELEEAPSGPLKIVMDARELRFLDNSFDTVTAFFTLMYLMERDDLEKVFAEVYRVLQTGGEYRIWDVSLPGRLDEGRDRHVVHIQGRVRDQVIETGYGQPWPDGSRDLGFYRDLGVECAFQVAARSEKGHVLTLVLRKPSS
jgi:ubiquinone/menaquinone biosynthesis C-methylase UbiE